MSHDQFELSLKITKPDVTQDMVDLLCSTLKDRDWIFARQLKAELPYDDRQLRAIAEHSDGQIISGQKGYRLFDSSSTCEDALTSANWLRSQGQKMINRSNSILRRYHRYAK